MKRYLTMFLIAALAWLPVAQGAQVQINRGSAAGDGTGETLYSAFGKINSNILDLQTNYAPLASPTFTGTVGGITKGMVGLGNVDNTADLSKPISTATQTAISGIAVSAESYGASPTASAATNATAINTALAVGGRVTLSKWGTYSVNASLVIDDSTQLYLAKGVVIQRAAGVNAPLLKNKYESYLLNGGDLTRTASATVVVNDVGNTRHVGETVAVGTVTGAALCPTAAYNGVVTVTAVTANTWSYTSGGSATDTCGGGSSNYYVSIIPVRSTVLSANAAGTSDIAWSSGTTYAAGNTVTYSGLHYVSLLASNLNNTPGAAPRYWRTITTPVIVTDAAMASKLKVGDDIWVGSTSTSDTLFSGNARVSSVTPGVSFTYSASGAPAGNPVGSLLFNFNVGITIAGEGQLDGNRANQASPGTGATLGQRVNTVNMTMVSRLRIEDGVNLTGAVYRALNCFNCSNVVVDAQVKDTLVGLQFEGAAHDVTVNRLRGESTYLNPTYGKYQADDFVAFTGTKYLGNGVVNYDNTTSPYGLGNFDFDLVSLEPTNCKNGVKITGYSTVHFKGRIQRVVGGAKNPVLINGGGSTVGAAYGVNIQDDPVGGTALVGGNVDDLEIDYVSFHDAYAGTTVAGVGILNSGTNGSIKTGYVDDGADIRTLVEFDQGAGSTLDLTMDRQRQVFDMTANGKPRYLFNSGTAKSVKFVNATFIPPTTGGASSISIKTGVVISKMLFKDSQYGANSAFSGALIAVSGTTGGVGKFVFDNFTPTATQYGLASFLYYINTSLNTQNLYFTNSEVYSNSAVTDGGLNIGATTFNYYLSGFKWTPGGNNLIQCNGSASVHNVYGGANNVLPSALYISGSGSQVVNFYTEAAHVDITTNARLGKPVGAKVWNTNAALGSLGVAGPVVSDGTHWHSMIPYASGTGTLVAGAATVSASSIAAGSAINLNLITAGGTPGALFVSGITPATSFGVASTSGADTSAFSWEARGSY